MFKQINGLNYIMLSINNKNENFNIYIFSKVKFIVLALDLHCIIS